MIVQQNKNAQIDNTQMKKKLIEVALPLDAINVAAVREKSIRHGHPSTLHLWWARRPLAACRAVLFSQLVDDPSAHPDRFPTADEQEKERSRLFEIIKELVKWENSSNEKVLAAARAEIAKSCDGAPPAVLDPFGGGGSIPLEAQRLGLVAHAGDLNPVAVLINKALIEIPPKFAGRTPICEHLDPGLLQDEWSGATGLAEDVRYYGGVLRDLAHERLASQYPTVSIPGDDTATVIAWMWARTVACGNPACGAQMPLLNSYALSRKKNRQRWLSAKVDTATKQVSFTIQNGAGCPKEGTVNRGGATCLVCSTPMPLKDVRAQAQANGIGSQLVCIVAEGAKGRVYVEANDDHVVTANVPIHTDAPTENLPRKALGFSVQGYGMSKWADLFTSRQLTTMCEFTALLPEIRQRVINDAVKVQGFDDDGRRLYEGGTGLVAYADSVTHYLALSIGRLANRSSSQCFWDTQGEKIQQVFARPALPIIWAYTEGNPFSNSSGNFLGQLDYLVEVLRRTPATGSGIARQQDARDEYPNTNGAVVCTDPPYYDNIPFADLSDFFYLWLRPCLADVYPDLFGTLQVPKATELIAEPARHDDWNAAAEYFERGLQQAFRAIGNVQDHRYPYTIFYAFKQSETDDSGTASTGWEKMLAGLLESGASIVRTWPMRTEQTYGLRERGRAALASSIILVCRQRPADAPVVSRRDFLTALRSELPTALAELQAENIAPVDLAQSAIGPGMAVFSRYSRVVEADDSSMTVRSALAEINHALDAVLEEQDSDLDADTRWALAWYTQHGHNTGSAGEAETLCKAKNTSIGGLVDAGILYQQGNECHLLEADELSDHWDPTRDKRLTVWETTHYLRRELMTGGEVAAAALLGKVGATNDTPRDLAYRLFHICERNNSQSEAIAYNALVIAWPEITRQAAALLTGTPTPDDLTLNI